MKKKVSVFMMGLSLVVVSFAMLISQDAQARTCSGSGGKDGDGMQICRRSGSQCMRSCGFLEIK